MKTLLLLSLVALVHSQTQNLCGTRTDNTQTIFADDPSECAAYLWCNFNSTNHLVSVHQGQCPSGFLFNKDQNACDANWSCTAKCEHNTEDIRVADPTDTACKKYTTCDASTPSGEEFECTGASVFNRNFGMCTTPAIAPCSGGGGGGGGGSGSCGPDDRGMINDESGCADFLFCDGSTTENLSCPDGFHFNPDGNFCDFPENLNPPCVDSARGQMQQEFIIPRPPLINIEAAQRNLLKIVRKH